MFWPPQLHFFCVRDTYKECLEFDQSVVEKLPSFVSSFRKHYKPAFLVRFVVSLILHICSWRVPWLHGCGRNAENVAK